MDTASSYTVQVFWSSEPCLRPGGFQYRRLRFASLHDQPIHFIATSVMDMSSRLRVARIWAQR